MEPLEEVLRRARELIHGGKPEVKEQPIDPVEALQNFIQRLKESKDPTIKRLGEFIEEHLERRVREFKQASRENPKLTPYEWVGRLTGMEGGDIVKGLGWNLEGLRTYDYHRQPGQFGATWSHRQIWEILGEKDEGIVELEERMWRHIPPKIGSFAVGIQGSYGPGSEGRAFASYEERGISVKKPGEKEAGIDVLLQVEGPYKERRGVYAHEGAILGLAVKIKADTLIRVIEKAAPATSVRGTSR